MCMFVNLNIKPALYLERKKRQERNIKSKQRLNGQKRSKCNFLKPCVQSADNQKGMRPTVHYGRCDSLCSCCLLCLYLACFGLCYSSLSRMEGHVDISLLGYKCASLQQELTQILVLHEQSCPTLDHIWIGPEFGVHRKPDNGQQCNCLKNDLVMQLYILIIVLFLTVCSKPEWGQFQCQFCFIKEKKLKCLCAFWLWHQ